MRPQSCDMALAEGKWMNDETWPALKWVFAFTPLWKCAAIIIPLAAVAIFAHGWVEWHRKRTPRWHSQALVFAALLLVTATLVEGCAAAYYYFRCAAIYAGRPSEWLVTQKAVADFMLSRTCIRLAVGIVGTSFCLALALLHPNRKRNTDANTASQPIGGKPGSG